MIKESETASGKNRKVVGNFFGDVPGVPREGKLHPVERAQPGEHSGSTGEQITQQEMETAQSGPIPAAGFACLSQPRRQSDAGLPPNDHPN